MNKEEIIQQKQQFLRKNIIDKGYDQTHFINFLTLHRENGTEVQNWTIVELE